MRKIKMIAVVAILMPITGCASIERTTYFEPTRVDNKWTPVPIEKFSTFGHIPPGVKIECEEVSVTFSSIELRTAGWYGPPPIPFPFPVFEDRMEKEGFYMTIGFEPSKNQPKIISASVSLNDQKLLPIEKVTVETETNTAYGYTFKWDWNKIESFILMLETSIPSCKQISVPYNKNAHITYSVFGVP